ncbi:MAG: S41 family peptidase [Imperialibacter sp.]|uniref:S41 family peptidase n=1 Tax=Imperialibacter sp. TaxID=2038411 RepID=UPI0032EC40ED
MTLEQQKEDFKIFRESLKEGHAGLYYYIDSLSLEKKLDSIANTFENKVSREDFYLKLAYSISLLNHGHTRIKLKEDKYANFRMAVLNKDKYYLPYKFLVNNSKLYIDADLSNHGKQLSGKEIISINGIRTDSLIKRMLAYLPSDGGNTGFKTYNLYNYFYFHYLFNLFYPEAKNFRLEVSGLNKPFKIEGKTPHQIDSTYSARFNKSISNFESPLQFKAEIYPNTAYLKVGSFYKGFIENYGIEFQPFLDNAFRTLAKDSIDNLILDLRDNEGGGDNYENILFTYLTETPFNGLNETIRTPGKSFKYIDYTSYLSDDIKAYINNPDEFLDNDSTLTLKKIYVDMMGESSFNPRENSFKGNIYVLINGGSFSATTQFLRLLYNYRMHMNQREIKFIGQVNGGDIYSNIQCAGQSYIVKLPNSDIEVDMPFLCFGNLQKSSGKTTIPDIEIELREKDIESGVDTTLEYVKEYLRIKSR